MNGGGQRPPVGDPKTLGRDARTLGGDPRTPCAPPQTKRAAGPAGVRFEPTPPSNRQLCPPHPPPPDPPSCEAGAARTCGSSPRRPESQYTCTAGRHECVWAPHCPEPHTRWRYRPDGAWRGFVPGGQGDRALRSRPQRGSVPTAPGTNTNWGVTPPPHTQDSRVGGISPGQRPPPGQGSVPNARPTLAPRLLFIFLPLAVTAHCSPRRVSSWDRTLRTSVMDTQAEVSHPADAGSLRPHGVPGAPRYSQPGITRWECPNSPPQAFRPQFPLDFLGTSS